MSDVGSFDPFEYHSFNHQNDGKEREGGKSSFYSDVSFEYKLADDPKNPGRKVLKLRVFMEEEDGSVSKKNYTIRFSQGEEDLLHREDYSKDALEEIAKKASHIVKQFKMANNNGYFKSLELSSQGGDLSLGEASDKGIKRNWENFKHEHSIGKEGNRAKENIDKIQSTFNKACGINKPADDEASLSFKERNAEKAPDEDASQKADDSKKSNTKKKPKKKTTGNDEDKPSLDKTKAKEQREVGLAETGEKVEAFTVEIRGASENFSNRIDELKEKFSQLQAKGITPESIDVLLKKLDEFQNAYAAYETLEDLEVPEEFKSEFAEELNSIQQTKAEIAALNKEFEGFRDVKLKQLIEAHIEKQSLDKWDTLRANALELVERSPEGGAAGVAFETIQNHLADCSALNHEILARKQALDAKAEGLEALLGSVTREFPAGLKEGFESLIEQKKSALESLHEELTEAVKGSQESSEALLQQNLEETREKAKALKESLTTQLARLEELSFDDLKVDEVEAKKQEIEAKLAEDPGNQFYQTMLDTINGAIAHATEKNEHQKELRDELSALRKELTSAIKTNIDKLDAAALAKALSQFPSADSAFRRVEELRLRDKGEELQSLLDGAIDKSASDAIIKESVVYVVKKASEYVEKSEAILSRVKELKTKYEAFAELPDLETLESVGIELTEEQKEEFTQLRNSISAQSSLLTSKISIGKKQEILENYQRNIESLEAILLTNLVKALDDYKYAFNNNFKAKSHLDAVILRVNITFDTDKAKDSVTSLRRLLPISKKIEKINSITRNSPGMSPEDIFEILDEAIGKPPKIGKLPKTEELEIPLSSYREKVALLAPKVQKDFDNNREVIANTLDTLKSYGRPTKKFQFACRGFEGVLLESSDTKCHKTARSILDLLKKSYFEAGEDAGIKADFAGAPIDWDDLLQHSHTLESDLETARSSQKHEAYLAKVLESFESNSNKETLIAFSEYFALGEFRNFYERIQKNDLPQLPDFNIIRSSDEIPGLMDHFFRS
ncbi:MAG: hypothetical protein GWP59_08555, partial [Chlamydiales bacterium]|nr:hypothetical protein [Chlamydiales bacterium]